MTDGAIDPRESAWDRVLATLRRATLAGTAAGLMLCAIETADRVAVLWPSFNSVWEPALFTAYLTPTVLLGLGLGIGVGILVALVEGLRGSLIEPLTARAGRWNAPATFVATTLLLALLFRVGLWLAPGGIDAHLARVARRINVKVMPLGLLVNHVEIVIAVGLVAIAASLVGLGIAISARTRKGRAIWLACAVVSLVLAIALYAVDSRNHQGRYELTFHMPAEGAQLVLLFVAAALLHLDSRRIHAMAIAAVAIALVSSGIAVWHLGENENLKALLWRRSIVARRAYQLVSAISDRDGDGFAATLGGGDLDDGNAAVNLLATELPGNGLDDNCIGGDAIAPGETGVVYPGPDPAAPGAARNFILISIDTLRADRMSAYGYSRPTSPRIEELARLGTLFERAYSQGTNTGVSFASMQRSATRGAIFDKERPTMFRRLADAGYVTTFINARRDDAWLETGRWAKYRRIILDGIQSYDHTTGAALWDGDKVTDRAIEYLSSLDPQERHATWVHYLDPHEPREKMAPYDFGNSNSDKYDTEVAFADREVGRLIDWLQANGRMRDSVVVLVADHGESFLDHGADLHGNRPYDEQIHVPLVMWAPDVPPARVAEPVGVWDIAPSVLAYFGAAPIPGAEGSDILRSSPGPRPLFAETPLNLNEPAFFAYAVTRGNMRYIYDVRGNTVELYDLASDPAELRNLADSQPQDAAELRAILAHWLDTTKSVRSLRREGRDTE